MTSWKINDITQGLRLRSSGMSYSAIAIVFREYHDLPDATECSVRNQLRAYGAAPSPRGRPENVIVCQGKRPARAAA